MPRIKGRTMASEQRQRKALVVGGSVAGLFAANLLRRSGWHVVILERVAESLASRGTGIARHPELERILTLAVGQNVPSVAVPVSGRTALDRSGAQVGWFEYPQLLGAWNQIFIPLRSAFPSHLYRLGQSFAHIVQDDSGVTVKTDAGDTLRVDLLVGADGFLSNVRQQFMPEVTPSYAGYVAWRGVSDERRLTAEFQANRMRNYCFLFPEHGQYIGYPMAGLDGSLEAGKRRYNYLWYTATPGDQLHDLLTATDGSCNPYSIAPHLIRSEHLRALRERAKSLLPSEFVQTVTCASSTMVQPIYDVSSAQMAFGRVALVGDAAFVVRPHVGIGVLKAAEDAHCLVSCLDEIHDIGQALSRYSQIRTQKCARAAAHGVKLGAFIERGEPFPDSDPSLGLSIPQLLRESGRPLPDKGF
jgi:2-polyprenyl-6-methoxyphenol hydroxylase-like FAD-dependent oxidoreductase